MKKKLLAILLAAIMVMTLLPTVAFATKPIIIDEVSVSLAYDFDEKTMAFTPAAEDEGKYEVPEDFTIDAFDKDGNLLYEYGGPADGSEGEWCDGDEFDPIEETEVDMDKVSFLVYECVLIIDNAYRWNTEGMVVNVNGEAFEKIVRDDNEDVTSTGYEPDDEYLRICIRQDLSAAPNNKANIKGTITAADFAYELIIPSETILTEDDHEDVLLGGNGKVSIGNIKHGANNIDISYTVDLTAGNLTDGTTTITTNYTISDSATGTFTALAEETEYTVYTGGAVKNTYIKVSADETSWNNAPVGDYNASVVFNFDDEEAKTVADIATGVNNWTNSETKYMRYYNSNLIIVDETDGTDAIASVPGTTVVTETTYDNGHDSVKDAWTCTVEGATYVFAIKEGTVNVVKVSGLSSDDYNGVYANRK